MSGSKTAYLSQQLLDHVLGGAAFTPPGTLYLCLSTQAFDPQATGSALDEVAASDYARVAVTSDSTNWSGATLAAPAEKHNEVDFSYPTATSSWGTPQSAYLADASTGGNLLYGSDISNPQPVSSGDTPKIPASTFIFQED